MTPIENAIAQLGGQTATGRMFNVVYQTVQQWIAQGRVPAEYCPRVELLTGVPCEHLNDRVEWSLIRSAPTVPEKFPTPPTIDHATQLRDAIANTRFVYAETPVVGQALDYLEQVLAVNSGMDKANTERAAQRVSTSKAICDLKLKLDTSELDAALALAEKLKEMMASCAPAFAAANAHIVTTMSAAGEKAAAAMRAESAQLVIQAEKAAAGTAARAEVDHLAVLSREAFSLSGKLQQPVDLVVQLLVLAELRGMRVNGTHVCTTQPQ